MHILNLIRWKNLLIILITEIIVKYFLIDFFVSYRPIENQLNYFNFITLALSTICIAAAGYIYNDMLDIKIDIVNRPDRPLVDGKIDNKAAKKYFYLFNIIGLFLGFYLAFCMNNIWLSLFQIFTIILLILYSKYLKGILLIGNIIIAFLTALVPFMVYFYDTWSLNSVDNNFLIINWSICIFCFFAFISNLMREIIKDKEDAIADLAAGCKTWAGVVSMKLMKALLYFFAVLLVTVILWIQFELSRFLLFISYLAVIEILIFCFCLELYSAKTKADFGRLSSILKVIMFFGILTPIFIWIQQYYLIYISLNFPS